MEISSKSSSYLDFQTLLKGSGLTEQADPAVFFVSPLKILAKDTLCAEYAKTGNYDFVFIRDDKKPCIVNDSVTTLLKSTQKNKIAFLVHMSGDKIKETRDSIKENRLPGKIIFQPVSFSHMDSDPIWSKLLIPFFKDFEDRSRYVERFENIWASLANPSHLRSIILTPLVALDLIHQASLLKGMDNHIMEDIKTNLRYVEQAKVVPTLIGELKAGHERDLMVNIRTLLTCANNNQEIDHALLMKVAQRLEELLSARS